jgi:hypothetical protein
VNGTVESGEEKAEGRKEDMVVVTMRRKWKIVMEGKEVRMKQKQYLKVKHKGLRGWESCNDGSSSSLNLDEVENLGGKANAEKDVTCDKAVAWLAWSRLKEKSFQEKVDFVLSNVNVLSNGPHRSAILWK